MNLVYKRYIAGGFFDELRAEFDRILGIRGAAERLVALRELEALLVRYRAAQSHYAAGLDPLIQAVRAEQTAAGAGSAADVAPLRDASNAETARARQVLSDIPDTTRRVELCEQLCANLGRAFSDDRRAWLCGGDAMGVSPQTYRRHRRKSRLPH